MLQTTHSIYYNWLSTSYAWQKCATIIMVYHPKVLKSRCSARLSSGLWTAATRPLNQQSTFERSSWAIPNLVFNSLTSQWPRKQVESAIRLTELRKAGKDAGGRNCYYNRLSVFSTDSYPALTILVLEARIGHPFLIFPWSSQSSLNSLIELQCTLWSKYTTNYISLKTPCTAESGTK